MTKCEQKLREKFAYELKDELLQAEMKIKENNKSISELNNENYVLENKIKLIGEILETLLNKEES